MYSLLFQAGADPVSALRQLMQDMRERVSHEAGPLVVFIVAAAIVLALAVTLYAAAALYCIARGGNLEWITTNGWRFWEVRIACRFP